MIAICPLGPPNEMNPSFSQNQNASRNEGRFTSDAFMLVRTLTVTRGSVEGTNDRDNKSARQSLAPPAKTADWRVELPRATHRTKISELSAAEDINQD